MADESVLRGGGASGDEHVRRARIRELLEDVEVRRSRGEPIDDEELARDHRELMPELLDELRALRGIRAAMGDARRLGPILESIAPLPMSGLDVPIDVGRIGLHDETLAEEEVGLPPGGEVPARVGAYPVLRELARGGQAVVFQARHPATGRTVAVKVLPGGQYADPRRRARLEQEARILAALDHPHIVGIIDRGTTADGSPFIVMDYVDGEELDAWVEPRRASGELRLPGLLELFAAVARTLHVAHEAGVVHRDLKPSNVFVDREGRPRVLDFGLSRLLEPDASTTSRTMAAPPVTVTGQILGSLPWASPELAGGEAREADRRCDVYALGVMLYHGLTGAFPYDVYGPVRRTLDNIVGAPVRAPSLVPEASKRWPGIGPALDAVVLKALEKDPALRQATAAELARELEACAAGGPGRARRHRPHRRAWGMAGAVLGTVCALVVIASARAPLPPVPPKGGVQAPPTFTNQFGMRFALIPAGRFQRGSPEGEPGRIRNRGEEGLHPVILTRPFYMGVTEVTQGQYRQVMGGGLTFAEARGDDLPAYAVTRHEAIEFCRRLSERDLQGRRYRLPTEAEWEYACRAGAGPEHPFGGPPGDSGWFEGNSGGRVHAVAGREANAWGLHDMLGNVREWCSDTYGWYPIGADGATAPLEDPTGAAAGPYGLTRGGDFAGPLERCRAAARNPMVPDVRELTIGFRVVLEARPGIAGGDGGAR